MQDFYKHRLKFINILFFVIIAFIILLGIYIRLRYYITQIPMWVDEIMLASSFINRSILDAFSPLDAYQKAPPLFVLSTLIIRKLFGIRELTLRFIPFILGILSMPAFFLLLKENIKNKLGIIVGLCLFTFSTPLIYFSAEFKPYGCDVFFCIILLLLYKYINLYRINLKQLLLYTLCTMGFVFISFPSIFVIGAMVFSKIIEEKKADKNSLVILITLALAGISLYLYDIQNYIFLKDYWNSVENGFNILPSITFISKFIYESCIYYIYNFNVSHAGYVLAAILIGFMIMFKDKKNLANIVSLTIIFAIAASLIGAYPLKPKLELFMLPLFILLSVKVFDAEIHIKSRYMWGLNIILLVYFIIVFGINVPYFNISERQLVYYNNTSQSRNKSLNDRNAVKKVCLNVINNAESNDAIIASSEFLYGIKDYKAFLNSPKNLNINIYADIAQEKLSQNLLENDVRLFVNKNLSSGNNMWFIGRDDEQYFQCPNYITIEEILNGYNLKYQTFRYKDIYSVYVPKYQAN